MEKFVEKFNIFDIFTTLIPGIVISSLFGFSLSFRYYDIWISLPSEKYILFFIFSYICGTLFQELGTIFDLKFLYKVLYGGDPRKIFLTKNKYCKIFNDEVTYKNALTIKQHLKDYINIDMPKNTTNEQLNSLIFSYCLNICETNGLIAKADKMIVISEMSRSLFWGCLFTIVINIIMLVLEPYCWRILVFETLFLIVASVIFLCRKKRYEQYRIRILIRTFLIFVHQQKAKK